MVKSIFFLIFQHLLNTNQLATHINNNIYFYKIMIPPKFQQDTRSLSNYTNRIPAIHIYLTDTKCHTAFLLHVMTFDGNRYEKSDAVTHSNSRETSKQNVF